MLSFDDPRWADLKGGYRMSYDPRPMLKQLEASTGTEGAWRELWDQLHHQGDVGDASYAAVPHLVRIHRERGIPDWNTYAIVGVIELARGEEANPNHGKRKNPEVPAWLSKDYFEALHNLFQIGLKELPGVEDPEVVRAILSIFALYKRARTYGRLLLDYSEDEMLEIESAATEI